MCCVHCVHPKAPKQHKCVFGVVSFGAAADGQNMRLHLCFCFPIVRCVLYVCALVCASVYHLSEWARSGWLAVVGRSVSAWCLATSADDLLLRFAFPFPLRLRQNAILCVFPFFFVNRRLMCQLYIRMRIESEAQLCECVSDDTRLLAVHTALCSTNSYVDARFSIINCQLLSSFCSVRFFIFSHFCHFIPVCRNCLLLLYLSHSVYALFSRSDYTESATNERTDIGEHIITAAAVGGSTRISLNARIHFSSA